MRIPIYHVDAFASRIFSGNPAAVCLLSEWLDVDTLATIAKENCLPATAFLVKKQDHYETRWFAPDYEIPLCGHGSLASGYIIFNFLEQTLERIVLKSPLDELRVLRNGEWITLDFPQKEIEMIAATDEIIKGLGTQPDAIYKHKQERMMVLLPDEAAVRGIKPDMQVLKNLPYIGITVTALGDQLDFVSRTFYPKKTIAEDPATGASHCLLAPYWAKVLKKKQLKAAQLSARGGEMQCEVKDDRVLISGRAVLYSVGEMFLTQ